MDDREGTKCCEKLMTLFMDVPYRFGCFGGVITTVGMETLAWYRYEGCVNDTEVCQLFIKLIRNFP